MSREIPPLPRPSPYAAPRMQPQIGDTILFCGQAYVVAEVLDMSRPIYPDWPRGIHYCVRRNDWAKTLFLIVPASMIEQPAEFAA